MYACAWTLCLSCPSARMVKSHVRSSSVRSSTMARRAESEQPVASGAGCSCTQDMWSRYLPSVSVRMSAIQSCLYIRAACHLDTCTEGKVNSLRLSGYIQYLPRRNLAACRERRISHLPCFFLSQASLCAFSCSRISLDQYRDGKKRPGYASC